MARHLESVQWKIRPCGVINGPALGQHLPINEGAISVDEVRSTIKKLRQRNTSGPDQIPAELLHVLVDNEESMAWITSPYNEFWRAKKVPNEWHQAVVVAIFKKGAPDQCGNYRTISLLRVA